MGSKRAYTLFLLMIGTVIFLAGCGEEKKVVEQAKEDFRILYEYEEDKIRPVLDGDMTEEELARKYLLHRLELEEDEPIYKERGVLKEQGIFIESAIHDGGSVPNITAITQEEADADNSNRVDRSLLKKENEFKELSKSRLKVLENQYDTDNTGLLELEEEIKRQVIEREQDEGDFDEDVEVDYEEDEEYEDI